jgi:hypothetical protein
MPFKDARTNALGCAAGHAIVITYLSALVLEVVSRRLLLSHRSTRVWRNDGSGWVCVCRATRVSPIIERFVLSSHTRYDRSSLNDEALREEP